MDQKHRTKETDQQLQKEGIKAKRRKKE